MGKGLSLRWIVFYHFAASFVALFAVIWVFHGQIFVSMYAASKIKSMEKIALEVSEQVEQRDFAAKADEAIGNSGYWMSLYSKDGVLLYASQSAPALTKEEISDIYAEAYAMGGKYLYTMDAYASSDNNAVRLMEEQEQKRARYAIVSYPEEKDFVLIAEGIVSPQPGTVEESRFYVLSIVAIIGIAVCLFSFVLSRELVKPLQQMKEWPRKMAGETGSVTFKDGYKEITQLNDSLDSAYQKFLSMQKYRREMIENVSHDLRTPLMMIICCTEMMRDFPEENTPGNLQAVTDEAKRLSEIVNDMMDLSRLLEDRAYLEKAPFSLTESLRAKVDIVRKYVGLSGYVIALESGEDAWVLADKGKILQVLQNLIINAVKHTGPNKRVVVRQIVFDDCVRLEVTDFGQGIPADRIPLIWERWATYTNPEDRNIGVGTGLGLAIVKGILDLHGAAFGVISGGSGSTFWFELERCRSDKPKGESPQSHM
ncbi:sensor histidine kinase [Papillibacter cinnamivorans]|uniref:histidine kinase n=1 Tax=Papillibacter cinnamivorans DSM 12816 TaxID=1122930 RepID=A0A1W2A5E0_9FIRM|nr:HAMP domain-containing sensor histidine kinase [Papillibacter cinnamivorans]SMC55870.1 Signal transduction histidine kinase [Papillibacter cinnamivorans DSM 12816]